MKPQIREIGKWITEIIFEENNEAQNTIKLFIEMEKPWKRLKEYFESYLEAAFNGIEEEVLKYVIKELKASYKRFKVLDVRGNNEILVLSYPVYKISYSTFNRVVYRHIYLLKEYGKAYVVIDTNRIDIDLDKIYSSGKIIESISNAFRSFLDYDYEIIEREALVKLDQLKASGRIRAQGDLALRYEVLNEEIMKNYIKGEIREAIARLLIADIYRYISRRLSEYRIEHVVNIRDIDNEIEIDINKSKRRLETEIEKAIVSLLKRELGLEKEDYSIYAEYRCPFGARNCVYRIALRLYQFNIANKFIDNGYIEELASNILIPIKYSINIGNHIATFMAFKNHVEIDMDLPFTGDTIRQIVRLNSNWYYYEAGENEINIMHSEHGNNYIRLISEKPYMFTLETITKPLSHVLIRNKIALRRFIEKYA